MQTLIFETSYGKIEIKFDDTTGNGEVYFYREDVIMSMRKWIFEDIYKTSFTLTKSRHVAWIDVLLPKCIGRIEL